MTPLDPVTLTFDPLTLILLFLWGYRSITEGKRFEEIVRRESAPSAELISALDIVVRRAASSPPQPTENETL